MALAYGLENTFPRSQRVLGFRIRQVPSPLTAERALRALIDFTLSNARRFYSSMGTPLGRERVNNVKDYVPIDPLTAE